MGSYLYSQRRGGPAVTTTTAAHPGTFAHSFSAKKLQELVLYIAQQCEGDPNFGKTKLNKVLFFADFLAYGIFGRALTGATYQRRDFGPVPKEITAARRALIDQGAAEVEYQRRFNYPQERLVAKRPPNMSLFTAPEKQLVDDVIHELWHHSAIAVSDLSHREAGWRFAKDREEIPYNTVFLSSRRASPVDAVHGQYYEQNRDALAVPA